MAKLYQFQIKEKKRNDCEEFFANLFVYIKRNSIKRTAERGLYTSIYQHIFFIHPTERIVYW